MSKHADRFTVVLDTNVLVGALTRNMLLSLAEDGLFRVRWSQTTLHQEFERTFIKLYGDGDIAARQRANIERAFPEGLVIEDPRLMASPTLPGPDDRHVLAAAIQTKAALIVTQNLKDFPPECLTPHEIEAISTDDFLADCIDLAGIEAVAAFRRMRERFHNPQIDAEALILRIEQLGLGQTATMLGEYRAVLSAPNAKRPPLFRGDSSNVDVALTCFAIVYTQAKRSTFNSLISLLDFVAGAGFEPVTFRL